MEGQVNEKTVKRIYTTLKKHEQIEHDFSKNHPAEYLKVLKLQLIEQLRGVNEREKAKKEKQELFTAAPAELKKINQLKTPRARMKKKDELIGKLLQA